MGKKGSRYKLGHLIKDDIFDACAMGVLSGVQILGVDKPEELLDTEKIKAMVPADLWPLYATTVDAFVTAYLINVRKPQTIIFESAQIIDFLREVDQKLAPGDYAIPFPSMVVQFTEPIAESLFLSGYSTGGEPNYVDDKITGLIIDFPFTEEEVDDPSAMVSILACYESQSVNRTLLDWNGDGEVHGAYLIYDSTPEGIADKQRIANLGMLCVAAMDSPGIEVEKVSVGEKVNRSREKRKARPLPDYYFCHFGEQQYYRKSENPTLTGRHVGIRFSVRGHFRKLPNGKVVRVRPHERGLAYEPRLKVYVRDYHESEPEPAAA